MKVNSSSDLLKEFTLYANKTVENRETVIVQRSNGQNLVMMSMEKYNEIQKQLFLAKQNEMTK